MLRAFLLVVEAVAATAQPIRPHPDNPRYFVFQGKPTVLVTSGEHYGAVLNRDFDFIRYLDTLKADGLNLTRTFSGAYREVPGNFAIASNTLAPAAGAYLAPWLQRDGKFDLNSWDARYFERLRRFVSAAAERGIVVELVLFCPFYDESMWDVNPMKMANNVNSVGRGGRNDALTLKDEGLTKVQDAMTAKIVSELREFDNVYYEICNEPYFGGVTVEWQKHIAQVIYDHDDPARRHMIAQNWANGSSVVDRPTPLVGLYNFHYSRPPGSISMNRHLNRAIGNNETGFDGGSDATYRIQGWDFLMAGGALYNNLDYSFTVGHEDGSFSVPASTPGGGSGSLRRQLGLLHGFFNRLPFLKMEPADVVRAAPDISCRALAEPGSVYAVYVHHGRSVKGAKPAYQVDSMRASRTVELLIPRGDYSAEWHDTHASAVLRKDVFHAVGEWQAVTSPPYSEDIVLLLKRIN